MATDENPTCFIYYRNQEGRGLSPRDHIIRDGDSLCDYNVSVPEDDSLKPLSEVSDAEWVLLLDHQSNLCEGCAEEVRWNDLTPDDLPAEPPMYVCPVCDEPADDVDFRQHLACVYHKKDVHGGLPDYEVHKIPREHYDDWRQNPEKFC